MDAGRFDVLTRSLDVRSRRGAFRALGLLGAVGLVDRLGVTPAEARKKKGGKKKGKKDCEECICPVVTCPQRDTCPDRSCCQCNNGPTAVSCHLVSPSSRITDCQALCGSNTPSLTQIVTEGTTVVCGGANQCVSAACPI